MLRQPFSVASITTTTNPLLASCKQSPVVEHNCIKEGARKSMYASVNSDCIGCGACEEICSRVFRINSYEIAEAYTNPVPQEAEESTKEAVKGCPVAAIILE